MVERPQTHPRSLAPDSRPTGRRRWRFTPDPPPPPSRQSAARPSPASQSRARPRGQDHSWPPTRPPLGAAWLAWLSYRTAVNLDEARDMPCSCSAQPKPSCPQNPPTHGPAMANLAAQQVPKPLCTFIYARAPIRPACINSSFCLSSLSSSIKAPVEQQRHRPSWMKI